MTLAAVPLPRERRHNLLRGKPIANEILEEVKVEAADLEASGWPIKLVSLTIGEVPEAWLYVRNQSRTAECIGITFEERNCSLKITACEILANNNSHNSDPRVKDISCQRQNPYDQMLSELQRAVNPLKDDEGMSP